MRVGRAALAAWPANSFGFHRQSQQTRPVLSRIRLRAQGFVTLGSVRTSKQGNRKLVMESVALGLGYAATLVWVGAALVASFTSREANPYWPVIPHLRTDTTGVIAFGLAIVSLPLSRYLQLTRLRDAPFEPVARPAAVLAIQAVAETAAVLATGLVIYLSLNAVTHPQTLRLQLTHLWPWPSEGTVRVIGLGICLAGVAANRYLRATVIGRGQSSVMAETVRSKADFSA